ncbi:hypothetical protein PR048_027872 [Dryococelus australis]|uniref:Uncharacterized protein n=1 Tax=Dryococelus australis TaxID=614101 RepID=A0ABQ9GHQ8_9NEOP|nr:hypothetical protein PR048_027872 [Dryococelus australis]
MLVGQETKSQVWGKDLGPKNGHFMSHHHRLTCFHSTSHISILLKGCAVARVFASHQCKLGSTPGRGRGGVVARLLASHQDEPDSILCGHIGIVPDNAAGQMVFSRISRFPHPCIPALLHNTSLPWLGFTTFSGDQLDALTPVCVAFCFVSDRNGACHLVTGTPHGRCTYRWGESLGVLIALQEVIWSSWAEYLFLTGIPGSFCLAGLNLPMLGSFLGYHLVEGL